MAIRMSDLPPKVREQVARKMVRDHPSGGKAATSPSQGRNTSPALRANSPQGEAGEGKYHNQKAVREVDGNVISFDSQKEARRFDELLLLWRQGVIRDLKLQEDFTLQEAYTSPETGTRVRAIRYRADFTYLERVGDDFGCMTGGQGSGRPTDEGCVWRKVVEDVKSQGTKTRVYEIKRKLLRERFGLEIREV